jgi:hypothetical protein
MHKLKLRFYARRVSSASSLVFNITKYHPSTMGLSWGHAAWHSWLRHCATSRKVAGSISDGVFGIFH